MSVKRWAAIAAVLLVSGCGVLGEGKADYESPRDQQDKKIGRLGGEEGIVLFGGKDRARSADVGITVNSYLWRASLDTVGFMPLVSADPFGGVIITDWASPPDASNDRMKVTVYVMDRQLRADGVKASVFRQTRTPAGAWVDASVDPRTATDLENAILTRARQLRMDAATAGKN